ncbi:MAG: amidohydrolase family protein, partial [Thermoanaerobaculia bacterium]
HDMVEVAAMALHVGQMTAEAEMPRMFEAVTVNGARTLGLKDYGLEAGCDADLVILQAADSIEALRIKPARLYVLRRGRVIAETAAVTSRVRLGEREIQVDFTRSRDRAGTGS